MPIPFTSIEKTLNIGPQKGQKKHFASTYSTGEINIEGLTEEIGKISTVSGADIRAVLYALVDVLPRHLSEGQIIRLGELGSFRISISSQGEDSPEKVTAHSIKKARLLFNPGKHLQEMLQNIRYVKKAAANAPRKVKKPVPKS
ncbi:MAG: HU family DNA-binding protein [Spirochaetota bacterium]